MTVKRGRVLTRRGDVYKGIDKVTLDVNLVMCVLSLLDLRQSFRAVRYEGGRRYKLFDNLGV